MIEIIEILKPETDLEKKILNDPLFIIGVNYGEVRSGHPEGKIIYHIRDVFKNIDFINIEKTERVKLRLISLFHDTCKFQVDYSKHRVGDNHHSRKSFEYAKNFIDDEDILQVIKYHDDAYNIWKRTNRRNEWNKGEKDLLKLINKINDIKLYSLFYYCDNSTGDKTQGDYEWFLKISGL